ncbi:MAG: DUF1552 domain-containing protein [Planctomycetota bacterium]|nr:MAG: DUF1552 domain-containing protein [Planctomycetota bacterium]REJ93578.1 MAG: DUF1552 domain-containing protein [Planctomycetota bacterium]REK20442.1 MAG: DUF1552 domain-containing protein [Planctomycetota bacterium]REK29265.1 MAG: DUF1552 domain-containing protein [Planctomycetota bacterium]
MQTFTNNIDSLTRGRRLSRRALLRGAGAALALPALDCMSPAFAAGESQASVPRRIVAINFELSFHPPNLMPERAGRDYETTPYLEPLVDLRDDFTIISGTSHPDVDGGHAASKSWLTGAPHPGAANFSNTISMDQLAAQAVGLETRLASMAVGSGGISVSANGVPVPASPYASGWFRALFIEGTEQEKREQVVRLQDGQSVLDTVLDSARRMQQRVSRQDRRKLDEYFTSVREAEQRLHKAEEWQHRPKPQVDVEPPADVRDANDIIARARQLYDIMYLALITDSTRVIAYGVGDSNAVATLPGVSMNYHDLSHHGQDPEKLKQLGVIEAEHVKLFGEFLARLKDFGEEGSNVLERTMVLMGSHMHSGGHNNRNLPILLAGGGFRHGQHLAFDQDDNSPLANLYVSMLQRMGLEVDQFASSTGTMAGLQPVG